MEAKFLNVKQIRTDLGITQLELSKKMDMPQGYLSQIENGKRKPSKEFLKKLKSLYGKKVKIDKYWMAEQPKKPVINSPIEKSDGNLGQQLSAIEKLISLLDKSQARVEALELENQKLKAEIEQLKSQDKV
ncbi:MAG: helix-turn-helix transcriptional regulator [Muribaculaceae bacterium]|nr:helix-turn-helix transcriptional regulator [Muribaculaceae bacterium]